MSYLKVEDFKSILDTVNVLPISTLTEEKLSQYSFDCGNAREYAFFLKYNAPKLDDMGITKTHLLIHKETDELIGYFSLSADTVTLTLEEKCDSGMKDVSFMSLPALKVGKLAVNKKLSKRVQRKGYGSFILDIVNSYAFETLENGVACRFVTVDADIEYEPDTPEFYEKNGFVVNESRKRKRTDKTVSMRRDIFA